MKRLVHVIVLTRLRQGYAVASPFDSLTFWTFLTFSTLLTLGAFAGCNRSREGFTMKQLVQKFTGPDRRLLAEQMFDSTDADVRRKAVEEIIAHKSLRREPYLGACAIMVKDPDPTVRSAAVRALAVGGDAKYVPNVAAALQDADPIVRADAAAALDRLPGEEAVAALIRTTHEDSQPPVRAKAARALRHYPRQDVLAALLACLDDPDFAVCYHAAASLRELTCHGDSSRRSYQRSRKPEAGTALDPGTDPTAWRDALAEKDDPFSPPEPRRRPWWNMLGLFPEK